MDNLGKLRARILMAPVVIILLTGLVSAPFENIIQNCVGTPQCWEGGNQVSDPLACSCAEVGSSDDSYAGDGAGYRIGSRKNNYGAIISDHSESTLPADALNISATVYVEWKVEDTGESCSVELYNGSAWTVLSTACQGTEALYSYAASDIDTVYEAEHMKVKVNYTNDENPEDNLWVDYIYVNVTYNRPPQITGAADDGGSSATSPTQEPDNIVFTVTATDANGDDYTLLVCDSSGQADGACTGTTICESAATASGLQASCNHATTGESGSYTWRAFACDVYGVCVEDSNSNSPYYVNNEPQITSVADDGGSSPTSPTQEPGNVVYTITAADSEGDEYKPIVCDSSGQSGGICTGTTICESGWTASGSEATCSHATAWETGSYAWRAYACDNQSTCVEDGNTNSPYYVNNEPTWTSVSADPSIIKYQDTVTMTSSGAADNESDNLRLECGESPGSYNLCTGGYGSGERSCSFSSAFRDDIGHTIYCALSDSFSYSTELNDTITSYTQPSVTPDDPPNNSNKSSAAVGFTWTVVDEGDTTLSCNLTVDAAMNQEDITVTNATPYTQNLTGLSEGSHTWSVSCADTAGHVDETFTYSFEVDVTDPALADTGLSATTIGVSGKIEVSATATDSGTGVRRVRLNMTYPNATTHTYDMLDFGTGSYKFNITGEDEYATGEVDSATYMKGKYTLVIWSEDWAGNINVSNNIIFYTSINATIAINAVENVYIQDEQVDLTADSWLNNTGSQDLTGYLQLFVMKANGSVLVRDWEKKFTVRDDLNLESLRTINADSVIGLDTIWDNNPWNTGSNDDGEYAVYARFVDDQGKPIYCGPSGVLEKSDIFAIDKIEFLSGDGVDPTIGQTDTVFNFSVTYTHTSNTEPTTIQVKIDGTAHDLTETNASDTDYTDGKIYSYSTIVCTGSHCFDFMATDGTATDITNTSCRVLTVVPTRQLQYAWNYISFPLNTGTFTEALSSMAGQYRAVLYWDHTISDFEEMNLNDPVDESMGYWIFINDSGAMFTPNGIEFSTRRVHTITTGACTGFSCFVSVGYNSPNQHNMDAVMEGVQINVDYLGISYFHGEDGAFKSYIEDPVGNEFSTAVIGAGYYIQKNAGGTCSDCVFDYDV